MTFRADSVALANAFEIQDASFTPSEELLSNLSRGISEQISSRVAQRALRAGDTVRGFRLKNQHGDWTLSSRQVGHGPIVIVFYRGYWCRYSNLTLQSMQAVLPQFLEVNATVIGVSPQSIDNSARTASKNRLTFPILSDRDGRVAAVFGLRYTLPQYLRESYLEIGIDLCSTNNDASWTLPIPARYIVEPCGRICYSEVDPDYTRCPDTSQLLTVLRHYR